MALMNPWFGLFKPFWMRTPKQMDNVVGEGQSLKIILIGLILKFKLLAEFYQREYSSQSNAQTYQDIKEVTHLKGSS
jgi:hypothetical protein